MKIESGRGVGSSGGVKRAGSAASPGFAPAGAAEETHYVASTGATSAVASLDALLALQAEEPVAQRRARQAKRGKAVLDALQDLEKGIVLGRAPAALKSELENLRARAESSGDAGLDAVMLEIDTRLAVELAKLEKLSGRA